MRRLVATVTGAAVTRAAVTGVAVTPLPALVAAMLAAVMLGAPRARGARPTGRCRSSLSAIRSPPAMASRPMRRFRRSSQQALAAKGIATEIANAGVSGDTTAGGLARLDWSVPDGTEAVILELGANDALRGVDPKLTRGALEAMLERLKARHIPVLLAGMLAPRNLGPDYGGGLRRHLSRSRQKISARSSIRSSSTASPPIRSSTSATGFTRRRPGST